MEVSLRGVSCRITPYEKGEWSNVSRERMRDDNCKGSIAVEHLTHDRVSDSACQPGSNQCDGFEQRIGSRFLNPAFVLQPAPFQARRHWAWKGPTCLALIQARRNSMRMCRQQE